MSISTIQIIKKFILDDFILMKYSYDDDELGKIFFNRYLRTHKAKFDKYNDQIEVYYGSNDPLDILIFSLADVYEKKRGINYSPKKIKGPDDLILRNIRNSWYNEACFMGSIKFDNNNISPPITSWKIVRFYYSIFPAISAVVRMTTEINDPGQSKMINSFNSNILNNKKFRLHLPYPINILVSYNEFNRNKGSKIPQFYKLRSEYYSDLHRKKDEIDSTPILFDLLMYLLRNKLSLCSQLNYFRDFRNWASYEDPFLFSRFYGPHIANELINSMGNFITLYLVLSESLLVKFYGLDVLNDVHVNFQNQLQNKLNLNVPTLDTRIELHNELSS